MHGDTRSRGVVVALVVAAAAFGAAAMMSAATAPTARADDFSDIIANVESELSYGQSAFNVAGTDFGGNDVPAGLTYLIDGVYDDTVGPPDQVYLGTLEALAGDPIGDSTRLDINVVTPPTDFADALTDAQNIVTEAETTFTDAATFLSSGDYYDAAYYDVLGSIDLDVAPEYLLVGAVEALGF